MILQVSKYYYPEVGGIERVVQDLSEGFVKRDQIVRVLAATKSSGKTERINGVEVHRANTLGEVQSVPIAPRLVTELRRQSGRARVIHYHLPNPLAVVADTIIRPDCPTVVTYHSDIVKQSVPLRFYQPLLHRFLERVDRIVTTSPELLEHSKQLQPHKQKCHVIPLGINPAKFDHKEADSVHRPDEEQPIVLFVGRLTYYKGVQYLIDAADNIEGHVVIAGDGPDRPKLEKRAREQGVSSNITFTGCLSEDSLREWYQTADVFVLPSVESSEAFGIVQLEAMASETPVVNTDLESGVPWVSQHRKTGLTVQPRDPVALSEAVNELVSRPDLATQYGQAARNRVMETFTIEQMVDQYNDLYTFLREDS